MSENGKAHKSILTPGQKLASDLWKTLLGQDFATAGWALETVILAIDRNVQIVRPDMSKRFCETMVERLIEDGQLVSHSKTEGAGIG